MVREGSEVGGDWASVNWGHKAGEEALTKPTTVKALVEVPGVIQEAGVGEWGYGVGSVQG
jgi:hypothetical protein